jgi:anti-sigma B factor antagonist
MFQATITDRTPRTVIVLEGELDLGSTPKLVAIVRGVIDVGDHHIVLDLAGLSFIDSTGLGGLAQVTDLARAGGATVEVRSPSALTTQALEVTGLDRAIAIAPA